jgi:predicted metal-binding membrane protein
MISDRLHRSADVRRFYLVLGCLIVVAWSLLIVLQRSAYAELLGHEAIEHDLPALGRMAAFLLSWSLMTVAMMLPGSLPMLNIQIHPIRRQMAGNWLSGLIILGYLFPWILFGLLAYLGDGFLHRMFESTAPLAAYSGWIAPSIMLVAGLYQFTPLKRRYTLRCQPAHAMTLVSLEGSMEKNSRVMALKQGLRLGLTCVGSCGSLMLLMFALGHNRLGWMFALCGTMVAERLAPWGHRLTWLVGLTLVIWATFWMLFYQVAWPG